MLNYRIIDSQKSEWVVFIHPLGGSSATFFKQVKDFGSEFNLLLVDLHGHGKSDKEIEGLSTEEIAKDVIEVLNKNSIPKAHFLGVCLGNAIIDFIYSLEPDRFKSIVYGSAVREINLLNRILLKVGNTVKFFLPHGWFYVFFALIMMPRKNHKESRNLFISEAMKMKRRSFIAWFNMIFKYQDFYKNFDLESDPARKLFLYGSEDHLFISKASKIAKEAKANLQIIDGVGHLCHVDSPKEFNERAIRFIKSLPGL